MTLNDYESPYYEAMFELEAWIEPILKQGPFTLEALEMPRKPYITLLDAYRQVFAHSLFHPRKLPKPFVSALKLRLANPDSLQHARKQAKEQQRRWTVAAAAVATDLLWFIVERLHDRQEELRHKDAFIEYWQ